MDFPSTTLSPSITSLSPSTTLSPPQQESSSTIDKKQKKGMEPLLIFIICILSFLFVVMIYDCFTSNPTPFYCFAWLFSWLFS